MSDVAPQVSAVAELHIDRDFLLRSLKDLDLEYAAGDLSTEDFESLSADYTTRLADVQRRIEGDQAQADRDAKERLAGAAKRAKSRRRSLVFGVASLGFAIGLGFLMAGALGERQSGETITGNDAVRSPRVVKIQELLARAQELSTTDPVGSLEAYRQVTKLDPNIVSAWAYGGWQLRLYAQALPEGDDRTNLLKAAKADIDEAIRRDVNYADPLAFRAVMNARDFGDDDAARADLKALELLNRNPIIDQLTTGLRSDLGLPALPVLEQ
jgi:tetratricopeptide (TPR) repeat protein